MYKYELIVKDIYSRLAIGDIVKSDTPLCERGRDICVTGFDCKDKTLNGILQLVGSGCLTLYRCPL